MAAPLVAAAVASPYLAVEDEWRQPLQDQWSQWQANPADAYAIAPSFQFGSPTDTLTLAPVSPGAPSYSATTAPVAASPNAAPGGAPEAAVAPPPPGSVAAPIPPLDASNARFAGMTVTDFADVLRFDITPEWLFSRWSRVTTITADQSLKGFRVPLVTGTRVDDLAGVATFYFGRHGRLQRVGFEGTTGDTRRLVAFLTARYGFKAEPNLGAGLYLVRWNARPMSGLRIDYAPVVRADMPHVRYSLKLEINRPDEAYVMSDEFQQILGFDQGTQRWLPF
jgi:hypothetical protein